MNLLKLHVLTYQHNIYQIHDRHFTFHQLCCLVQVHLRKINSNMPLLALYLRSGPICVRSAHPKAHSLFLSTSKLVGAYPMSSKSVFFSFTNWRACESTSSTSPVNKSLDMFLITSAMYCTAWHLLPHFCTSTNPPISCAFLTSPFFCIQASWNNAFVFSTTPNIYKSQISALRDQIK